MPQNRFDYIAYIDEAGDEGFGRLHLPDPGRQSKWFLLGAAIVEGAQDALVPRWRNEILARFPTGKKRDLHFRDLKHAQKVVVSQELAMRPVRCCVTFSNKITLVDSRWAETFKRPGYLYNYMTRWLLERVTTYVAVQSRALDRPARLKVMFSRRQNTNYQSMIDYMHLMRDGREKIRPVRSIDWTVFDPADIAVENHSVRAGLQVADAYTSAFFSAVEPNGYGNTERAYAKLLRKSPIRSNGNALNCGITPVPSLDRCRANDDVRQFFESFFRES